MSSSATFWAAKSTDLKSSQAPAQATEPVAARVTPKKNGVVLKGQPPARSNTPANSPSGTTKGVKKSNWADSEDEEEFVTSFNLSGRVKELEKTISAKDSRITDLTTAVQEKETRITELEAAHDEHKQRLTDLQHTADASAAQADELKDQNHKQFLHVQKLVAEVDDKDRRIAALQTEFDEHCATIADLGVAAASSLNTVPAAEAAAPFATTQAMVEFQHESTEATKQAEPAASTTIKAASINTNPPVNPSAKAAPTKAAGPAPNLSEFPVFATSATVKHTAPPAPAPKLKTAVDPSKFATKSAAKPVALKKKKVEATSNVNTTDGPAPIIDSTSDIRTKRREERALFANGPKVQVKMGDTGLSTLPKYIVMQCSHKAFKHFTDNPDATTFIVSAGSMDEAAAKAHLEWMKDMTYQGRVYSITLHSDEKFDDKNLQICRAARVLGLNNMYVGHFTKIFCDRIRSNTASYEFLHKIAALAYPENDPLYDCLTNNLAILRTRNAVKTPTELEALLEKYPGLRARIVKIEQRMHKKHEGTKKPMGTKVDDVGKNL